MKKTLLAFTALLLLIFAVSADTATSDVARIHVVANSDSEKDIRIKMKVVEEISLLLSEKKFDDSEDMKSGLENSLDEIISVSNAVLLSQGADYTAQAEVSVRHFDKKSLGNSAFPEGDYLALTVTLGEGQGYNWWSVMFPGVSLEASLAMGEEGKGGKTVLIGCEAVVKIRCLIFELCNLILTKR